MCWDWGNSESGAPAHKEWAKGFAGQLTCLWRALERGVLILRYKSRLEVVTEGTRGKQEVPGMASRKRRG